MEHHIGHFITPLYGFKKWEPSYSTPKGVSETPSVVVTVIMVFFTVKNTQLHYFTLLCSYIQAVG